MVKMIQDIGNKLEAKIDKLKETLCKAIEDLKIKQAEMQNTMTEMKKKSLEAKYSRMQEAEEWMSGVEDRLVEINWCETEKRKKIEKK